MRPYEAMFLFDPTYAADFPRAQTEVERILGRAGAEVTYLRKWDERKLAYEIKGRRRGCYVLTYFNCDPEKITGIERDAKLSENVLRMLVRCADGITEERIRSFLPETRTYEESSGGGSWSRGEGRRGRDRDDRGPRGGGDNWAPRESAAPAGAADGAAPGVSEPTGA